MEKNGRKPKNIKLHNQKLVINLFRSGKEFSASEIAAHTQLSITTAVKLLDALMAANVIQSIGKGESTLEGGKKPELYVINSSYKYAIGCYGTEMNAEIMLTDFMCNVICKKSLHYSHPESADETMREIAEGIRSIVSENNLSPERLCGISIGLNGIVDSAKGILSYPVHNSEWGKNLNILCSVRKYLPEFKNTNIIIDNAGRFAAYSLLLNHPEYKEKRVFSIIATDYAVGCFMEHGNIVHGNNGLVGEIGHIRVVPGFRDYKCACGNYGCFESLVNSHAIIRAAKKIGMHEKDSNFYYKVQNGLCTYKDIFTAADQGSHYAQAVVEYLAELFSVLIRDIMLTTDPEILSISGIYSYSGEYFQKTLLNMVQSIPFEMIGSSVKIDFDTSFDITSAHIGGAYYMIEQFIRNISNF